MIKNEFLGNVVWLDDITSTRALINMSRMPDKEDFNTAGSKTTDLPVQGERGQFCLSSKHCLHVFIKKTMFDWSLDVFAEHECSPLFFSEAKS